MLPFLCSCCCPLTDSTVFGAMNWSFCILLLHTDGGVAYLHRENGEGKQMSRLGSLALEAGSDSVRLLILTCGNSEAADGCVRGLRLHPPRPD